MARQSGQTRIFRNEGGVLCAEINGVAIHSSRNPQREAEKLMPHIVDPAAKGFVVFGLGLAYHLEVLTKLFPRKKIICFEPDAGWHDLVVMEGIHITGSVAKFVFADSVGWRDALQAYFHEGYQLIAIESQRRAHPQIFEIVNSLYGLYSGRNTVNRNTLKRFGSRWVENLLINFLCLEEQQTINAMRAAFPAVPALLLAGGPSLQASLPLLTRLRQRMLIMAVDTTYLRCREAGVEPDFLIAVDPQYWNTKHFERASFGLGGQTDQTGQGVNRAILISESSAHPRTFRLLQTQPPCFSASLFPLGAYFEASLPPRDLLGAGGSVATTAWDFLRYIGAVDIYSAGLDMGFPNRETHFRGSYFEESIAMSGTALRPAETAAIHYLFSGRPVYREAYNGKKLLSDKRMDLYCSWFEDKIRQDDRVRSFVLSEWSRRIPGMELADQEQLLLLPKIRPEIDARLDAIRNDMSVQQSSGGDRHRPLREELMSAFQSLQVSMQSMAEQCSAALSILSDYGSGNDSHNPDLLRQLNEIDNRILSTKNRKIAGFLINDAMETLTDLPQPASLSEAMSRSAKLYRELLGGIRLHLTIFHKTERKITYLHQ